MPAQNTNNPLVSVVIPTYNRADTLGRAIRSVMAQTYTAFEIIVADDNPSGEAKKAGEIFSDRKIVYCRTAGRQGASAARNLGIANASGDLIAFLDDDDEFLPERLEATVTPFFSLPPDYGLVYCGYVRESSGSLSYYPTARHRRHRLSGDLHGIILEGNFITPSTVTARKADLLRAGGFDEQMPQFNDWDLWIRLSRNCKFHYVKRHLVIYHVMKVSISADNAAGFVAHRRLFSKYEDDFLANCRRRIFAYRLFKFGRGLIKNGEAAEGLAYMKRSIALYPFNLKFTLKYFLLKLTRGRVLKR